MKEKFTTYITSEKRIFAINAKEVWKYRDLISLFVARNLKTKYKQTVLGPLWFVIQPLLTTFIFTVVFGYIANLSTSGAPKFLFYLAGNVPWLFFAACVTQTSATFLNNARTFGKVYFPRLTVPVSTVITCGVNFLIQFGLFLIIDVVFVITGAVEISLYAALLPVLVLELGILGMGVGITVSALTVKYRDLQVLVSFGVQLWMYLSPVVYSVGSIGNETLKTLIMINPVSPIIEFMRAGWIGTGETSWMFLGISWAITLLIAFFGIALFNRVEKNFMDSI